MEGGLDGIFVATALQAQSAENAGIDKIYITQPEAKERVGPFHALQRVLRSWFNLLDALNKNIRHLPSNRPSTVRAVLGRR